MKTFRLLLSLSLLLPWLQLSAAKNVGETDRQRCETAIRIGDEGRLKESLAILDSLANAYPDDYEINYERIYALYRMRDYETVIAAAKKLVKNRDASPLIYQLYGNALDLQGRPREALDIYAKGLRRFPDAGMLYLEGGNIFAVNDQSDEALRWYNAGIARDPMFASNYYRAAEIYFDSDAPVWSLVYAETEILLNPNNEERLIDMSKAIARLYRDKVKGDRSRIDVNLAKGTEVIMVHDDDDALKGAYLGFPGVYEMCVAYAIGRMIAGGGDAEIDMSTIDTLARVRRLALQCYDDIYGRLYGNRMYLLEFQRRLLEAGHWEAYNHFLLSKAYPAQFDDWLADNTDAFDRFVDWYNAGNTFRLDADHSVGVDRIFDDVELLPLTKILDIETKCRVVAGEKTDSTATEPAR